MKVVKVLFVGTFFSKSSGSLGISEFIASSLPKERFSIKLTSTKHNRFLRIIDIILSCLFGNFDKIQIDTYSGQAFFITEVALAISHLRGIKTILTLHGGRLPEFYQTNYKRIKRVFSHADYIQTPSLYLQEFFEKQGIHVNYLPNPINLDHFPYYRENIKQHSLLWVRAFTEIYNPDLAVLTLFEVRKQFPNTTLTMIGPDKGLLLKTKTLINELGLDAFVQITGPVKNDLLYKYYQTHEIFLNTTSFESFGVAVAEAASCGIPVVSTKVGEIPYIYQHKVNMLFVNGFESKSFAAEVMELMNSKDLSDKISKNARIKVEEFDWSKIKIRWDELLTN